MNSESLVGIILGITFGLVLGVLAIAISNKDKKVKTEYDERQQQVRGKGFRYAFFVMMAGIIVLILLKTGEIVLPIHDSVLLFFVMILGVAEYVTYAIMHDAYFGINNSINSYLLIFAFIALINIAVTVASAVEGRLVTDGVLGLAGINMLCGAMFLWIFIVLMIKKASDERED